MDSGLVVSPIYQNFPTKRRPPPPPRPAVSSDTEPPPLPPRMNREKQPLLSGTSPALVQEPTQCPVYGKEKHRIEVIPLGKHQDEDVRVDTSKMNFKDLMMQWKNNSPGENSSSSDLRRHEQKFAEKYQSTGRLLSSVPPTLERTKPNISVASTYRHEPTQKLEATSPVFSSASPVSTPQSSTSKSAFSTSPTASYAAMSEPSSSPHHPSGVQPSLNIRSSPVYTGLRNISSSPIEVQPTTVAYIDGFSNTTESSSGIRMKLANQNSPFNSAQTPPSGRISFLANSRSRSSSDLLSVQLPSNDHLITAEPAPVKLHRFLRDRSSSAHDILSDKSLQSRSQPRNDFKSPQDGNVYSFPESQSAEGAEASTLKSPLSLHGEGMQNTPIAYGRLSNSTLALSDGYEITGGSRGFADESYIGHKNKSSRTVGTYKRSFSAAGAQLTNSPLGKPSGDSDSTPFKDSKLGQQSWNSESVLSSQGTGVKTLPNQAAQAEKGHKDGIQNNQGYITEATHSSVTPVRPPRPNARGRQQAKQSSANPTASSSNVSQKTKLASVSLPALDSLATSSFNIEQGNVSQTESPLRPGLLTPASPLYGHNQQDHWSMQQESNSSGTLTASGQVLDRRPEISPQHSHYSPQHRQLALNNSLNISLSRASLDHAQPQSLFIQNSTAKPLSPCSPNEQSPVHTPSRDHQRQVIGTTRVMTAFNNVEDTPKTSLENSAFSSHYRSSHSASAPQESKHKCSSTPSLNHMRQPSQEEIECDEKAKELAEELDENDKKLLEVLQQDRAKKRMLYMDGLFSDIVGDQETSSFKHKSRSSMKNRTLDRVASEAYDSSGSFKSYSLPRDYQQTSPFKAAGSPEMLYGAADSSSDASPSGVHENLTVMKHKEELVDKLHKKIQVLKDEKLSLQQEIADNVLLGQQVCQVADSRCQTQNEKEKFMTFIEDLEKIVRLLLNLSGQLARAENAVQALGPETDTKLKKMTWDKREKLHAKHEEAKLLKEAVDKRSEQLLCMLQERLTTQELTDYKHFINMKSRLTIEMQEVDDHLALAEQQMAALQQSLPASAVSFPGKYMEA